MSDNMQLLELVSHLEVEFTKAKAHADWQRSMGKERQMYYEAIQSVITLEGILLHIERAYGIETSAKPPPTDSE